jgi:1,4-alpha-glucan branching enzyme
VLNTDSGYYGGSNVGNGGGAVACTDNWHGGHFMELTLPPLAAVALKPV